MNWALAAFISAASCLVCSFGESRIFCQVVSVTRCNFTRGQSGTSKRIVVPAAPTAVIKKWGKSKRVNGVSLIVGHGYDTELYSFVIAPQLCSHMQPPDDLVSDHALGDISAVLQRDGANDGEHGRVEHDGHARDLQFFGLWASPG